MRRGRIVRGTALAGAVTLAACGGGGRSATGPTVASTTTPVPTSPTDTDSVTTTSPSASTAPVTTAAPARRKGTLLKVDAPTVQLNGTGVSSRTDLHERDTLGTGDNGEVDFSLDSKVKMCTALKATTVVVAPDPGTLLRWDKGSAICVTTAGGATATFGAGTDGVLKAVDPVFQVTVDGGTTTVKVDKGFVSLSAKGSPRTMIVGFGEQASVESGGPQGLGPFAADSDPNSDIFDKLDALNPVPTYARPGAAGSTLPAIFQRGQLDVSTTAAAGSSDDTFIHLAMARLSSAWRLHSPVFVPGGPADIVVTARPASAAGLGGHGSIDSVPLFAANGVTWSIVFRTDPALRGALQTFVSKYLNTGDYAAAYSQAYDGAIPSYDALGPVLFGG